MLIETISALIFLKVKIIPGGDVFSRVDECKDETVCDVLTADDSETC